MSETLFGKLISSYIPLPMCIVNSNGKVVRANDHISEVFIYDGIEDADFLLSQASKYRISMQMLKTTCIICWRETENNSDC